MGTAWAMARGPVATARVWRRSGTSVMVRPRVLAVTAALAAFTAAFCAMSLALGTFNVPLADLVPALLGRGEDNTVQVVRNIRLPRVLAGVFAGAALGVSGSVFQSISRNALGSPDVIGFTTGAATGAIAQIVFFGGGRAQVAMAAVVGGVATAVIVYLLSVKAGVTGGYRLVLTGIGVSSILAALNGLMLVRGDLDNAVVANLWLAGSLNARTWAHAVPVTIGTVLLIPAVLAGARSMSLIEMGDDLAAQLGVRVERTRILVMFLAVVLAALATAATGPIAFIALAAPQLVIRLTRTSSVPVLSAAAMGAALLTFADVVTRLLPWTMTVPIGRMTGIVGGLYLIWLLTRSRQV